MAGYPSKAALIAREVDQDLILENRHTGGLHRLNPVARAIWERCDGTRDSNALASEVAACFGKSVDDVARDVDATLARFTDSGLVCFTSVSPNEAELLLRCVGGAIDTGSAGRGINQIETNVDWNVLLQTALRHGVMPLLYTSAIAEDTLPATVRDRLRDHYRASIRHNTFLLGELVDLLAMFEAHGIRALPLKGPVLAATAYGTVALRQYGDLDVFVLPADAARAKQLLIARGYQVRFSSETDVYAVCERRGGIASVDLQWALAPNRFRFPLTLGQLWDRLEPLSLGNALGNAHGNITVWQPPPGDYLLILCAHAAKHCWSRLQWIADIAAFTRRYRNNIDWDREVDRAAQMGGKRLMLLGLQLAADLIGTKLPAEVVTRMRADPVIAVLASELRERLFTVEHPTHFQGSYGHVEGGFLYMRTRERLRDKAPTAWHLLKRPFNPITAIITPTDDDRSVWLPPSAGILYYLVRPIRLTRKHGMRLVRRSWARRPRMLTPGDLR